MASYIGSKLRITRDDGQYEGILHSLDIANQRMTLENVTCCSSGKTMSGCFHFFSRDVNNVEILEDNSDKLIEKRKGKTVPILSKKELIPHLSKLKNVRDEKVLFKCKAFCSGKSEVPKMNRIPEVKPKATEVKRMPTEEELSKNYLRDVYVIDSLGDVFTDAVDHIKTQLIIGVAMEGINLGRKGQLCWIQVATRSHIFLFDFLALKRPCLDQGLADILENTKIQKVIHDCRQISDLLHHQYGISLINVFDTQVADVMIYKSKNEGDLPRYVNGLAICLHSYLNLSIEEYNLQRLRENKLEDDQSTWAQRPASSTVLDAASKNVRYLRELRVALMEELMGEFTTGVDIYLGCIRDCTDAYLQRQNNNSHLLIPHFEIFKSGVWKGRNHYYNDDPPSNGMYDEKGFRENCVGVIDPEIIYSRDGVMHAGDGTMYHNGVTKSCAVPERRSRSSHRRACSKGHNSSDSEGYRSSGPDGVDSVLSVGARKQQELKSALDETDIRFVQTKSSPVITKKDEPEPQAKQESPKQKHDNDSSHSGIYMRPAGLLVTDIPPASSDKKCGRGMLNIVGVSSGIEQTNKTLKESHVVESEDFDIIPCQKKLAGLSANAETESQGLILGRGKRIPSSLPNLTSKSKDSLSDNNNPSQFEDCPSDCSIDMDFSASHSPNAAKFVKSPSRLQNCNPKPGLGRAASLNFYSQ